MSKKVDWKQKYFELRSKYLNAIDTSFRLGVQEGQKNAEMENLQQQVTQMEEAAAMEEEMGGMVDENGMPIEEGMPGEGMPGEEMPGEEMPGEEQDLDSSINELEGYVKNEDIDFVKLMKSTHKMKAGSVKESKNAKADKVAAIVKSFNEESEESTENGEIIGQS